MKLLLVEDEVKLAETLRSALERAGHAVDIAGDGEMALDFARVYSYDLVLLDVMLPKLDGYEVLRQLRGRGDAAPVLMLTAREDISSKVRGLDTGADDYLTKPFELDELLARVRALLRRHKGNAQYFSPFVTSFSTPPRRSSRVRSIVSR